MLACALVMGCSGGADPVAGDPSTSDVAPSPSSSASEETAPSPSATDSEETESESEETASLSATPRASASAGSATPAASQSLAIEQRHPNGSVLRVTSLEVEATSITVGIEVVNGLGRAFGLAEGGAIVTLTDDAGSVYEFIEPIQNEGLTIEPRGTLTGELVYFGILNPEATTLRMQTNVSMFDDALARIYDPTTESTDNASPHFSVEIPLNP